jgi:HEAT repeat protein
MLGLWGGDDAALNALIEAYAAGHRELKEQILEAVGNIHSPLVVPFLVERLQEPSQTLRLIAAASLLRALN